MRNLFKRVFAIGMVLTITVSVLPNFVTLASAADVTAHVRILGSSRTIWFGDVATSGCTVTDTSNVVHTFSTPVAICALDKAAQIGGFTYKFKDFGGSLGLYLEGIAEDNGAADFSTYWLFDVNGSGASNGVGAQIVNNGDKLFFHFEDPSINKTQRAINDGVTYMKSQQTATGEIAGFSGVSVWAITALSSVGVDTDAMTHGGPSLLDYLEGNPPAAGSAATVWERAILAITAAGKNPYNFGGVDYVAALQALHNNSQVGVVTQINDDFFGLLALIAAGNNASSAAKTDALNYVLSHQDATGGFSWSTTGTPDVDDTAAALQALAAAKNAGMTASGLDTAITNAKNYLLAKQNPNGGFGYDAGETSNTSSTAWTVMALSALDLEGQTAWNNAVSFIRNSQQENGSFAWQAPGEGDTFTTTDALTALSGKSWPVKTYIAPVAPTVAINANPTSINQGQSSTLSWLSTNATSCTASNAWSGTKATSGNEAVSPVANATYTISCQGAGGNTQDSVTVNVTVAPLAPTVDLTVTPSTINQGESTVLAWTSSNATSCTASGAWSGSKVLSGNQNVTPSANATYTLSCQGTGGNAQDFVTVTVNSVTPDPSNFGVKIDNDAPYSTDKRVKINLTYPTDTGFVWFDDEPLSGRGNWRKITSVEDVYFPGRDGVKTVYAKFKSKTGQVSALVTDTIILDTKGPKGDVWINSRALRTNNPKVNLSIQASDSGSGVIEMMVSDNLKFTGGVWEPFSSTKSWSLKALSSREHFALRKIYMRFKDAAGNISTREADSILLTR